VQVFDVAPQPLQWVHEGERSGALHVEQQINGLAHVACGIGDPHPVLALSSGDMSRPVRATASSSSAAARACRNAQSMRVADWATASWVVGALLESA